MTLSPADTRAALVNLGVPGAAELSDERLGALVSVAIGATSTYARSLAQLLRVEVSDLAPLFHAIAEVIEDPGADPHELLVSRLRDAAPRVSAGVEAT